MGNIVRSIIEFWSSVSATFAEHDGIRESSGARGNMDRSAPCEIETTHLVYPAVRIPSPASDRVIDEGSPDENENHARKHASAFRSSADGEGRSNSSEHALENGVS